MKIIFLDIDGVLLPERAYALPGNKGFTPVAISGTGSNLPHRRTFDPVAVSMVRSLVEETSAQLVWSSSWASLERNLLLEVMTQNGVEEEWFHPSWRTPRKLGATRAQEIGLWLDEYGGAVEWVTLDNDASLQIAAPPSIEMTDPARVRRPRFSPHDGLTLSIYSQAAAALGSPANTIDWAFAKEIGTDRPLLFTSSRGRPRLAVRHDLRRIHPLGYAIIGEIWYRLADQITEPPALSDALERYANAGMRPVSFAQTTVGELAKIVSRQGRRQ